MPPPAAEIARHIIDAFVAKDHERAATLQLQFALFPSKWMHRGLAPVMKAAMKLIGVPVGDPYPPYGSLSDDELDALAAVLRASVLGNDARFAIEELPAPREPRDGWAVGCALKKDAGDLALAFGSRAGVYIGGGITPKLLHFARRSKFIERFLDKGRVAAILQSMPISVILEERAALYGVRRQFDCEGT